MKNMKKIFAVLLSLSMIFALCACGSNEAPASKSDSFYFAAPAAMAAGESEMAYAYEEAADFGMNSAEPSEAAAPLASGSTSEGGSSAADINPEKIIYSARVTVETTEFDASVNTLAVFVEKYGGFIESSSVNGGNYSSKNGSYRQSRTASYTIRVPGYNFNDMLQSFSEIGNVPYKSTNSENITSQYYDQQARLNAYKTQETRLLELMEKAETVEDIITIEDRLTYLRYEIESMQSTLNNWDRKVNYSTINLSLEEVLEYTPEEEPGFFEKLGKAAADGIESALDGLKGFILWLVEALPTLVILALIFFFIVRPVWKNIKAKRNGEPTRRQRRKAEKAAKKDSLSATGEAKPEEPKAE